MHVHARARIWHDPTRGGTAATTKRCRREAPGGRGVFPVRDGRGVYHFDETDVDAVAEKLARGELTLWTDVDATGAQRHDDEALRQEVVDLRKKLDDERTGHRSEMAVLRAENQELEHVLKKLLSMLESHAT